MKKTIKEFLCSSKVIFSIDKNLFAFDKENSDDFTIKAKSSVWVVFDFTGELQSRKSYVNLKPVIVKLQLRKDWARKVTDCKTRQNEVSQ